jgi:hypothetical protein
VSDWNELAALMAANQKAMGETLAETRALLAACLARYDQVTAQLRDLDGVQPWELPPVGDTDA